MTARMRIAMVVCLSVMGCGPRPVTNTAGSDGGAGADMTVTDPSGGPASQEISLSLVTPDELVNQLKARMGKVVLVDMWASW